jgi:hypothetical protein
MRALFIPATEGYGHVSRTRAIAGELVARGIECHVLTDRVRADFLVRNGLPPSCIDPSLFGISYAYWRRNGNNNLNIPFTIARCIARLPLAFLDLAQALRYVLRKNKFDVVINDLNLTLARMPNTRVINMGHYTLPRHRSDLRRMFTNPNSLFYEGFVEPFINLASVFTERFSMDIRRSHIDYTSTFPPVVARTVRDRGAVRKELGLTQNDRLIIDSRSEVPLPVYQDLAAEYPDLRFLVRSRGPAPEGVIGREFIPALVEYVAAADLFITNPGFASIGEGAVTGTPMLFNDPGNHFEQVKNLRTAEAEGYGRRIGSLPEDILEMASAGKMPRLENGLPYLVDRILAPEQAGSSSP